MYVAGGSGKWLVIGPARVAGRLLNAAVLLCVLLKTRRREDGDERARVVSLFRLRVPFLFAGRCSRAEK